MGLKGAILILRLYNVTKAAFRFISRKKWRYLISVHSDLFFSWFNTVAEASPSPLIKWMKMIIIKYPLSRMLSQNSYTYQENPLSVWENKKSLTPELTLSLNMKMDFWCFRFSVQYESEAFSSTAQKNLIKVFGKLTCLQNVVKLRAFLFPVLIVFRCGFSCLGSWFSNTTIFFKI